MFAYSNPFLQAQGLIHPTLQLMVFPCSKVAGRGFDYPPTSSAEVKHQYSYTFAAPRSSTGMLRGELPLTFPIIYSLT